MIDMNPKDFVGQSNFFGTPTSADEQRRGMRTN